MKVASVSVAVVTLDREVETTQTHAVHWPPLAKSQRADFGDLHNPIRAGDCELILLGLVNAAVTPDSRAPAQLEELSICHIYCTPRKERRVSNHQTNEGEQHSEAAV